MVRALEVGGGGGGGSHLGFRHRGCQGVLYDLGRHLQVLLTFLDGDHWEGVSDPQLHPSIRQHLIWSLPRPAAPPVISMRKTLLDEEKRCAAFQLYCSLLC